MITIKKITLKDGSTRYRAPGVSVGKNPVTGRRAQRTITCRLKKEVEAELSKIGYQVSRGTYVAPWDGLVPELLDSYLASGAIEWEANTRLSYELSLKPAREWFAHHKARTVTREQVQQYRDHLLASGRRRGGKPGTGLSPRSVNLALGQFQAAYELGERDGRVAANPVRFVRRVKAVPASRVTWSAGEVRQFLATAAGDRLHACWLLSLLGLRRGEVLGLRWSDVDLEARTITIGNARVLVSGAGTVEKPPKSDRGYRVLPADDVLVAALQALRLAQMAELDAAGTAYANSGYVCVDELGEPVGPERYSDEFTRLSAEAGVTRCRLHDARHSANSLLATAGVPPHVRAAFLGHTKEVNVGTYTHSRPEDLVLARDALARIYSAA